MILNCFYFVQPRPPAAVSPLPASRTLALAVTPTPGGSLPPPPTSSKYHPMQTRVRFGLLGSAKGQFNSPHGFCLGVDEDIVVADTNNHRIQVSGFNDKIQIAIPSDTTFAGL